VISSYLELRTMDKCTGAVTLKEHGDTVTAVRTTTADKTIRWVQERTGQQAFPTQQELATGAIDGFAYSDCDNVVLTSQGVETFPFVLIRRNCPTKV
jgi:hypothetical protein